MKIEEVEVFQVKLPVKDPFKTSFGVMCEQVSVVMKIRSEGLTAWGESSPFWAPIYSSESTGSVCLVLKDFLLPAILGKNLNKPEELLQMIAFVRGNQFAKSAIEIAFWNLMAEAEQKPLHVLLGGIQEKVTVGAPIGIQETPQILLQEIERFLQKGYHRIKLKIMHGWDMDILREVRKAFPKIKLTVDPNAAYSIKDTEHLKTLDEFNLMLIEQPLDYDDIIDHAKLQAQLKTPIALDESVHTLADTRKAIELKSARILNIKICRVGGLANSIAIHNICQQAGWPVWVGGMMDMGIGAAVKIEFASLPNVTLPGDIAPSDRYFIEDIVDPPVLLSPDGTYEVSKKPGIGRTIKESFVREKSIAGFTLRA